MKIAPSRYVSSFRGAWTRCCHSPLESTACPHLCCVYQHTLAKDTTSRPCLLKPCRDRPMGWTHGMRALGELRRVGRKERKGERLTPPSSVCRMRCTGLRRGLPGGRGRDPCWYQLCCCCCYVNLDWWQEPTTLSLCWVRNSSQVLCMCRLEGYLGTGECCWEQHVQTGCMQYEMQKEMLYLRPLTSRQYSGQHQTRGWQGVLSIHLKVWPSNKKIYILQY